MMPFWSEQCLKAVSIIALFLSIYQMRYRDRAKERRDKWGMDAIVPGWKKRFERERAKNALSGGDSPERAYSAP